jgi:DNA-binding transcriptional LysR family regulator
MLAGLEARLGVRLVERTTRQLAPTEAGRRLAERARRVLADYAEAIEGVTLEAAAPRGRLRIAAPLVFGRLHVAPVVTAFLDAFPEMRAELVLSDAVADLLEEGIDVALRIGALPDSGFTLRRLGSVRRVVVASPAYLERHGTPQRPEDVADHAVIHFGRPGPAPEWLFAMPGGVVKAVPVTPHFMVNVAESAVDAAIAGRGLLGALGYQAAAGLGDGRLVRLLRPYERPASPVALIFPTGRLMPRRLRAFIDFAAPRLSAIPALGEE